jgi:two-component system sensor histidine kinase KdpD
LTSADVDSPRSGNGLRRRAADWCAGSAEKAGHGQGTLRIYLGAAPGVGKTYAVLDEGIRRRLSSYT